MDEPTPTGDIPEETIPMLEIEQEVDAIADLYAEQEPDPIEEEEGEMGFAGNGPPPEVELAPSAKVVLLPLEEARAKVAPKVLEVLGEKFNGSVVGTRHLDDRDSIF